LTAERSVPAPDLLWDGPADAEVIVLLAHGAGAGRAHPFLARFAAGLGELGLRVARFDFPYMAARAHGERRGPDRAPVLLASLRAAAAATGAAAGRLALAGKSMGGRMATMLADELGCRAVIAIGYPFHPPRQPDQLRTEHLRALRTRCLILQGERDPFGSRAEVAGYPLSAAITVQWFADGDHSLVPRARSGATAAAHFSTAIAAAAAFARAQ
jgi:predicted alpha/beta-hydrolase family hydrolase